MIWLRRALVVSALSLLVWVGSSAVPVAAETATPVQTVGTTSAAPSPTSSASAATPTPSSAPTESGTPVGEEDQSDSPDVAPDNSRQVWALFAAGGVALAAALVVFLRRR